MNSIGETYFSILPLDVFNIITSFITQDDFISLVHLIPRGQLYQGLVSNSNWEHVFLNHFDKLYQDIKNLLTIDYTIVSIPWMELYFDFKILNRYFEVNRYTKDEFESGVLNINTQFFNNNNVTILGIHPSTRNMIFSLKLSKYFPYIYEKSLLLPTTNITKEMLLRELKPSLIDDNFRNYLVYGDASEISELMIGGVSLLYIFMIESLIDVNNLIIRLIIAEATAIDVINYDRKSYNFLTIRKILMLLPDNVLLDINVSVPLLGDTIIEIRPHLAGNIKKPVARMLLFDK